MAGPIYPSVRPSLSNPALKRDVNSSPGRAPSTQQLSFQPSTPGTPQPAQGGYQAKGGFDLSGPSASEQAYGQYGSQLAAPGQTESYAQQGVPQFQQPGRAETYARDPQGLQRATAGTESYGAFSTAAPLLGQRSATERFNAAGGPDNNATASGQYFNSLSGGQNLPAANMDAYYNRQREVGGAQLDKAAAARGMFGSTAALDQQRQLTADLGGQQARDEAQYGLSRAGLTDQIMGGAASRADTAGLGRYNSLLGGAQASDSSLLGRLGQLGQISGQADSQGLSRYLGQFGVQQGADAGQIGRFNAGLGGVQAADGNLQGRLGLLGQGAGAADAGRLGRVNAVGDQLNGLTAGAGNLVGSSYNDMFNANQGYIDMASQLGLGAGNQALQGAIANTQGVQALGAQQQAAAGQADQTALNIYGQIAGRKK
jgi:hypothetical protein